MRKLSALLAALLLLTACSSREAPSAVETGSETELPAAVSETTAQPFVPEQVDTEWGWYEIDDPQYADYTLTPDGGYGVLTAAAPDIKPETVHLTWNSQTRCLSAADAPNSETVTCSLMPWRSYTSGETVYMPAYMDAAACKAVCPELFPETVSEYLTYMITHYENHWEQIPALYLNTPQPLLPYFEADSSLLAQQEGLTPELRRMWLALLLHAIYTDPFTYNVISENGIDLEPCEENDLARPVYALTEEEYFNGLNDFQTAWEQYLDEIRVQTAGATTLETALIVADYICSHCTYDLTLTHRSIQSGLLEGTTVCMGYTQWFNATMQALGYCVTNIMSESLEHVWSAVYIPEEARWAEVDVTWMDGSYSDADGANSDCIDIRYFDFNSRDDLVYPRHCCTDQESVIGVFTPPEQEDIFTPKGYGYYFADVDYAFCKEIIPQGGGVFSLIWNTGEETTLQLN